MTYKEYNDLVICEIRKLDGTVYENGKRVRYVICSESDIDKTKMTEDTEFIDGCQSLYSFAGAEIKVIVQVGS